MSDEKRVIKLDNYEIDENKHVLINSYGWHKKDLLIPHPKIVLYGVKPIQGCNAEGAYFPAYSEYVVVLTEQRININPILIGKYKVDEKTAVQISFNMIMGMANNEDGIKGYELTAKFMRILGLEKEIVEEYFSKSKAEKELKDNKLIKEINNIEYIPSFNDYQTKTKLTNILSHGLKNSILYMALGMCDEAGEVAGKIKKIVRDNYGKWDEDKQKEIEKELGDVLWYLTQLATIFEIDLKDVAKENLKKLFSRMERDKVKGSGDNR